MTPTRAQIESWDPASLTAIADAWIALGSKAEDLFSRYLSSVTTVHGAYWEGETAEAAQDRAAADRKTAGEVVDAIEALAKTAQQGFPRDRRSLAAGPNGCSCSRSGWICGLGRASAHGHRGRTGTPPVLP